MPSTASLLYAEVIFRPFLRRIRPVIVEARAHSGEHVIAALATHYAVRFEEVHDSRDIDALEEKYLKKQRELGFGRLRDELEDPSVDALLIQRIQARPTDPDKWVAVLNLQQAPMRGYWDRSHELSHRIAEPAQLLLPFRRHRHEARNPVEQLIDHIAGELAFYPPLFKPIVMASAASQLTFKNLDQVRLSYAPTSSLLASANAIVKHWPRPALLLTASLNGRKNAPEKDRELRVIPQARNALARAADLFVIPNMRIPRTSAAYAAFVENGRSDDFENLATWTTSSGKSLANVRAFVSAMKLADVIYVIVSL